MGVAGSAPKFTTRCPAPAFPVAGILLTGGIGLFGVVLNFFVPERAFEVVLNIASVTMARLGGYRNVAPEVPEAGRVRAQVQTPTPRTRRSLQRLGCDGLPRCCAGADGTGLPGRHLHPGIATAGYPAADYRLVHGS